MENKNLTAVEWLVEKFFSTKRESTLEEIIEQAKEMEKQQIIDAYKFGLSDEYVIGSKQYYNETYGSNGSDETKTDKL